MALADLVPQERDERLMVGGITVLSVILAAANTLTPFDHVLLTDLLTPVIMAAILVSVYRIVENWNGILAYHFRVIGTGVIIFIVTWSLHLAGTEEVGAFPVPYVGGPFLGALLDLLALGSLIYIAYGFHLLAKEPQKMHFKPESGAG